MILSPQVKQVAGEFVQSGFNWVAEHLVETVFIGGAIVLIGLAASVSSSAVAMASAVLAIFTGISLTDNKKE